MPASSKVASRCAKNALFFILLLFVLPPTFAQILESPCPRLFLYEPRNETDRWYGTVTLFSDSELSGIRLKVILDRKSTELGNWFGEVITEDHKEYLIQNKNYKLSANTPYYLKFYIKYKPNGPTPRLVSFRLNAKTVCPEGGVTTTPPTTSRQLITRKPLGPTPSATLVPTPPSSSSPQVVQKPTRGSQQRPSPSQSSQNVNDDDFPPSDFNYRPSLLDSVECGTIAGAGSGYNRGHFYDYLTYIVNNLAIQNQSPQQQQVAAQPLIVYGQKTSTGQFPWHAALYHSKGVGLDYVCGGSLVSRYHVITAAHCVTRLKSDQMPQPKEFVIFLGKYYLKRWGSPRVQTYQVAKILRHPKYSGGTYQNDVVVLKLASAVEFTDYIRPVCLWEGSEDIVPLVGKLGTVVGWGYNEYGRVTEELIKLNMPVISKDTCIYSFPNFYARYTTSDTFCAGFANGSTVCNGDSGGGMVFPKSTSGNRKVYQLRGIVSLSVSLQNEFKCNPKHYVIFMDVAKYSKFINSAMQH